MNKRVLIIGATSGIAKAIAYEYAQANQALILSGRDLAEMNAMASDLRVRYGIDVSVLRFDALDYDSHPAFFEQCTGDGSLPLEGIILAYGYLPDQTEAQQNFQEAKRAIEINYTSCVSILERAAHYFEEQKRGGFITVISSVAGDRGRQSNYLYGSTKGALSTYLQGLRNRLHPSEVRVLTVKPGFVDTAMTYGQPGMMLVAQPEQVAKRVLSAIKKGKDTVYAPAFWTAIMFAVRSIPEKVFKRMKM